MSPAPGANAGGVRQAPAKPRNGLSSVVRFGRTGPPALPDSPPGRGVGVSPSTAAGQPA